MATLERISFVPMRESVHGGIVRWEPDRLAYPIANLPQIYWEDGRPWSEANHWALTKAQAISGGHIKTVTSLMKHLAAYASWLELADMDWRHFPSRYSDRAIVQFRGALIFQRDKLHTLAPSTTTARMRAVIQFYRHAQVFGFVQKHSPMWVDRQVVVRIHDSVGFERTMILKSSNLAIPNRARAGGRLEDGLTPLREEDLVELLKFSDGEGLLELHYMLALGIMSGARFETITTLRKNSIKDALPAAELPGFYKIRVGPGTGVRRAEASARRTPRLSPPSGRASTG
ncbi:MAG: hypothetical protein EOO27_03960 [Comamonadaceae bacterium]|nr:MAG: hypothetical protein EOO27_03960 [Comamonadaceae bacterium]